MRAPGFYDDIPEAEYHADRDSLSVSGAKVLLKAPALFRWEQDNGRPHKAHFDVGHAAHSLILGVGDPLYVAPFDNWQTKQARLEKDIAREEGMVPLLPADYEMACDMADALTQHRMAAKLFSDGKPEVSAYAVDETSGVMRRGRFDYLRDDVIVDYKTTATSSDPALFSRDAAKYGYHCQAAWYLDLARDLGHKARGFVFVVQEKAQPHLISVVELDPSAVERGRELNARALERFRDCRDSDIWPGYLPDTEIASIDLPRWAYFDQETA